MRAMKYYDLREAPVKIRQTFTGIGDITIEPSKDNDLILIQLGDKVIPYKVRESGELHDTKMEFKGNTITRNPMVDVMYVLGWMADDDLTNLVAQLFGIEVPIKGLSYTLRPDLYRIVA